MSKTDKDRPYWVRVRDYTIIDHDHTRGRCIIDDDRRNRWSAWRGHWRHCKKRVRVEYTCTKKDPNYTRSYWRDPRQQTCWTWVCGCTDIPDEWKREWHSGWTWCENKIRVGCVGHSRIEFHPEIPCACDDKSETPTCFPDEPASERWSAYGGGGVPHWYVNHIWHAPERVRERDELRDAARRYNAGDDLEDFDFENRQARNCARWYWT